MELANNILKRCREKGLTVTQLARLSGVKQPTLHGWTTGRSVKNMTDLKKVCAVLEIGIHQLLFGGSDPHGTPSKDAYEQLFSGNLKIVISRAINEKDF